MTHLIEYIARIKQQFLEHISRVCSIEDLEHIRISFLGRKGSMASLMDQLKGLSVEEKRIYGPQVMELRAFLENTITLKREELQQSTLSNAAPIPFDVTSFIPKQLKGSLHIFSQVTQALEDIFTSMGCAIVEGPELEDDYHNFKALNIPDDHPARESHDTFWLSIPGRLMRTHTSPVQIRIMETHTPPLALVSQGPCYRNEATDATHEFMFMQTEALVIDKNISLAHLLDFAKTFLQKIFNSQSLSLRVRPGYFPFVEPGVEIDCSCPFCKGGCNVCKYTGWIELLGAGLVHPQVLKAVHIDPTIYSGFALGMGLERLIMIRHGITDIRLFRSSKLDFLTQF